MQRDTALAVVLAVLALLALGVAAATLTDTVSQGESGSGGGAGTGGGSGDADQKGQGEGEDASGTREVTRGVPAPPFCAEFLKTPRAIAIMLGAMFLVLAFAYYDTGSILPPIGLFLGAGIPLWLFWYILTACGNWRIGLRRDGTTLNASSGIINPGGSAGGAGEAVETAATSTPSLVLGLFLVLAIAVAVVLLFVSTGDAVDVEDAEEDEEEILAPEVAAIGRAAGRAADRIEGPADVENEVYRAWVEMTDHLNVEHPRSSTPSEFATAAIDAGLSPDDVRELTTLFEEVRYGGEPATDRRESRALAALRRIESTYAEASDDAADAADAADDGVDGGGREP